MNKLVLVVAFLIVLVLVEESRGAPVEKHSTKLYSSMKGKRIERRAVSDAQEELSDEMELQAVALSGTRLLQAEDNSLVNVLKKILEALDKLQRQGLHASFKQL